MIVGTAEILVLPITKGFEKEIKVATAPGFTSFRKDAEAAGADAGAGMRRGVAKETEKLASDTEKAGAKAGEGLHKGVSGGLSKLAGAISATGLPLGALSGGLEKAGSAAEHAGSRSSGLAGHLDRLGKVALIGAAGGLAVVAAAGVRVGEEMQSAETKIAGAAGTTVKAAQQIGSAFETTAGKSEFSAVQMAQAFAGVAGQLKSAEGHALSAKEALTFMSAASDLAAAKQIDLGTATSATAGIMQAFQLQAGDAAHVTDVLFQASNATGQGVDTLASSLERVRSKLGETAPPLGDLAALMVDMTKQGITGRAALGALNASMNSLLKPTKQAGEESKKLGLQTFDSAGKFVGLGSVIDQLHPRFARMTQAQQLQAATSLFGAGAARQMTAVIDAGPAAYDKASAAVNRHGAAQTAAAQQAKTLHGEEATLKAEMSDLAARVGAVLIPVLTAMIGVFVKATTFVTSHKAALIALGAVVAGVLGPAIAVFTVNKMAAFGRSFTEAAGHVKSFAADVEGVVKRVISALGKQSAASDAASGKIAGNFGKQGTAAKGAAGDTEKAATRVGTAEGTMVTETTTASGTIEGENTAAGASFTAVGAEAGVAATEVGTAETALTGEVAAADTAIEGENAAAGLSFSALLPEIAAVGVALGVTYGALKAAGAVINTFDSGPPQGPTAAAGGYTPPTSKHAFTGGAAPKGQSTFEPTGGIPTSINIPHGAKGAHVTRPTVALIGEAGAETLIPDAELGALAAHGPALPALSAGAAKGAGAKSDLSALATSTTTDALTGKTALMVKALGGVVALGTTPMKAGAQRDLSALQGATATTRDVVDQKSTLMVKSMTGVVTTGTTPMQAGAKRDLSALAASTATTRDVVDQKSTLMVKSMTGVVTTGTTPMQAGAKRDLSALAASTATSFGAALTSTQTATKAMTSAVSTQTQSAMLTGSKNFEGLGTNVAGYMGATSTAVGKGLSNITSQLNSALKAYGAGAVSPSAVAPASAASLAGLVTGAGVPGHFSGAKVTQPMYRVGEEAPAHPEYVIASNPAYRSRNLGLWAQAGKHLGVPGFAKGGGISSGSASPFPARYAGLPQSYDQGVDVPIPAGTPEFAVGPGVIVQEGIPGFGPNAPILRVTSGPLAGMEFYYGHSGADLVKVGQSVAAGQQITEVGAGIVGISTGPHIEFGVWPPRGGAAVAPILRSLLAGKIPDALGGGGAGAAPWTNLKAPAWTGPGGALGQLGKGALAKALAAANAKGQQVAASTGGAIGGSVAPIGNEKQIVIAAAQRYGVPANILGGVFGMETDFGHNVATSSAGAVGDFQFLPSTAAGFSYPLTNTPSAAQFAQQASSAAQYLASLDASHHGDWNAALKAYSGGGYGLAQVLAKGAVGGYAKGGIPFAGAFGSGGSVTASRPTLAMFGERGAETAHFVPGYATGGVALSKELADEKAAAAAQIAKLRATIAPTSQTTYTTSKKGVVTGHVHHTPASAEAKANVAAEIAAIKAALAVQIAQQKGALAAQTAAQKAELHKQSGDLKAGTGQLNKLLSAIHSGSMKTLESALWQAHLAGLGKIERSLDHDHSAALAALSKQLVAVHAQAMKDLVKAQAAAEKAAAEKASTALLSKEATDLTRSATDAAQGIADQTKVTLDAQAEAGLSGAGLVAAQSQVALDLVVAQGNQAISAAQAGVDNAAGGSPLQQAQAGYGLAQAQAAATISQAQAQSALDTANAAAQAASAASSATPTPSSTAASPGAPPVFNFSIYGNGTMTATQLFSEVGWAIRTGALPVAPPVPAPA